MTELLVAAFKALGPAPTFAECEAIATAVIDSEDPETVELIDAAEGADLVQIAEDAGISGITALDFISGLAMARGDWKPGGEA